MQNEWIDKVDQAFSDGRSRVCGENLTATDFELLSNYTGIVANPHGRNPSCQAAILAHAQTKEHYMRVVNNVKKDCQASVDKLNTWI